jgi:hypothetical protein
MQWSLLQKILPSKHHTEQHQNKHGLSGKHKGVYFYCDNFTIYLPQGDDEVQLFCIAASYPFIGLFKLKIKLWSLLVRIKKKKKYEIQKMKEL